MSSSNSNLTDVHARKFYLRTMKILMENNVPFLVGGAFALNRFTGIERNTKDFDVFIRGADCQKALDSLAAAGYKTELTDPVWIAKGFCENMYVDFIFGSANGLAMVDEEWFEHSVPNEVLGVPVLLCPPEEIIWQKAYIMERDRFDGADIAHIILTCGDKIDWERLLDRFGLYWRVLLAQLILYGFIYPAQRERVPKWVMQELAGRLQSELQAALPEGHVCQGTFFSTTQYEIDINKWGYVDGRPENVRRQAAAARLKNESQRQGPFNPSKPPSSEVRKPR